MQTIWPALYARRHREQAQPLLRERWTSPDGDFILVDRQSASTSNRPLLVLFHGLEGSSTSHYAQAFADWARRHDVNFALPHFRGCGGEMNTAARAYHSGDHEEIHWVLKRLRQQHQAQGGEVLMAAGVSLGGNALMLWAAKQGHEARTTADAVASICSPLDLLKSGHAMGQGLNKHIYTRMFLNSMKPKAMAKWAQFPHLFDRDKLLTSRNLHEFDNVFTAPLHGFKNTDDYWTRASAKPWMRDIRIPALALNARNDPFVPANSLPTHSEVSDCVTLWQPEHGGHVGFGHGRWPGHIRMLPEAVGGWLMKMTGCKLVHNGEVHG